MKELLCVTGRLLVALFQPKTRSSPAFPFETEVAEKAPQLRSAPIFLGLRLPVLVVTAALVFAPQAAWAQTQTMDEDYARAVKEWTTRPEFLNPLVDHLPKSSTVPSPKDVLGEHIGKPGILHNTVDIYRYFRALEAKSARVKLATIGRTEEGKEILVVFVSSEENIRNLELFREYLE